MLDAVVDFLPSPIDLPSVEGIEPRTDNKLVRRRADDQPLCLMAFKTIAESTGDLTFVRVYSGVLKKGTAVLNTRTGKSERIGRLVRMFANKREPLEEIHSGDIGAIIGLKNTYTGDTLCDEENPIQLNKIVPRHRDLDVARAQEVGRPRQAGRGHRAHDARGPDLPRADQRGHRAADHQRHGRAAPGGDRQPHHQRATSARSSPASRRWPTSSACAARSRPRRASSASRAAAASTP
jgi:hypothetical protein